MCIIYTNTKPDYLPPVFFKRSLVAMAIFVVIHSKRKEGDK